jgi:hypothetical protein
MREHVNAADTLSPSFVLLTISASQCRSAPAPPPPLPLAAELPTKYNQYNQSTRIRIPASIPLPPQLWRRRKSAFEVSKQAFTH